MSSVYSIATVSSSSTSVRPVGWTASRLDGQCLLRPRLLHAACQYGDVNQPALAGSWL